MPHRSVRRSGQVMVEAMVALGALTLGYLAILALLNQSLGVSSTVSDRNIATYLAAEGIEITRNLSDAAVKSGTFADDFMNGNDRQFLVSWDDLLEVTAPAADGDNYNPGRFALNTSEISPLLYDSSAGYNYSLGTPTRFTRIIYTTTQPTYIKVRSVVSWAGKGGLSDSVILEDFFFNWR